MNTLRIAALCWFAGAMLAFTTPALASSSGTFEFGGGMTRYHPVPNGTWYQKGFPYRLKLQSAAWMVGWRQPITRHVTAHIDWVSLGSAASDSWDTSIDANYNLARHRCYGTCAPMAHFVGRGSTSGLALSIARHFGRDGWFFLSAGLYINRVRWEEHVYHWQPSLLVQPRDLYIAHHTRWEVAQVVGVGVRFGRWTLTDQLYAVRARGDSVPAIFWGANTLIAAIRF
ncbi:MAG: hypothetical protein ACYCPH_00535 [Minisyncoccota bacterium]